jgi:hypothetical protein
MVAWMRDLLLDRDAELAAFERQPAAVDGGGRVIVVEGPAGIGKSSLLAAVARTADARGHSNRDTAEQLYITQRTVETHLTHAFQTLDITARTELTAACNPTPGHPNPRPPAERHSTAPEIGRQRSRTRRRARDGSSYGADLSTTPRLVALPLDLREPCHSTCARHRARPSDARRRAAHLRDPLSLEPHIQDPGADLLATL